MLTTKKYQAVRLKQYVPVSLLYGLCKVRRERTHSTWRANYEFVGHVLSVRTRSYCTLRLSIVCKRTIDSL